MTSAEPDTDPGTARRGRPRSIAVDTAVIETVLHLLEEGATIGDLSIERIARSAGVGKAAVYRRWSGKDELMLDVLRSIDEEPPPLAGESVRDDLVALVDSIRRRGLAKRNSAVLREVLVGVHSRSEIWEHYYRTVIEARREQMFNVLRRGIASGELRDDIDLDLLSDLFAGPMLARSMLRMAASLDEGLSERIVDAVLEGVRKST
ncbi:TetR/AcrR family transcriptional regulator [Streptomyces sp. NBC_01537]|uniref:TetR/AcrR family transcriptional regulator n=1 Tax=Streptomyces sp. NBC_01537 TaxID=2903896 RepID=UPI0038677138